MYRPDTQKTQQPFINNSTAQYKHQLCYRICKWQQNESKHFHFYQHEMLKHIINKQVSAVADEPDRQAASRQTCCKQRWTQSVINLQLNYIDNACDGQRFQVIC